MPIIRTYLSCLPSPVFPHSMHSGVSRLFFLQTHGETGAHLTAIGSGIPAQQHCDSFRFRRAAFYNGHKSTVGLTAAKAAALRIHLNIDGCCRSSCPRILPYPSPPLQPPCSQSPRPPRSLVRGGQTHPHRPRLVVSFSTCPSSPPRPLGTQHFTRYSRNKHSFIHFGSQLELEGEREREREREKELY